MTINEKPPIKFCSKCGSQMMNRMAQFGFNEQTGEPKFGWVQRCERKEKRGFLFWTWEVEPCNEGFSMF